MLMINSEVYRNNVEDILFKKRRTVFIINLIKYKRKKEYPVNLNQKLINNHFGKYCLSRKCSSFNSS